MDLIEAIENDAEDIAKIIGHIEDRGDNGQWETFTYDITYRDGERESITLDKNDLGDDVTWQELFDYLDDWAEEFDVDYENEYE